MNKSAVISARIDQDVLDLVDRISKAQGRSRAWFAARAIEQVAKSEAELMAFLQEGMDDLEAGRFVDHEQALTEIDAMIARLEARCAG